MASSLSLESRRAEQSKISAKWIGRIRQCMSDGDKPRILQEALDAAGISAADLAAGRNIEQRHLDEVAAFVLPHVPDITLRVFAVAELTDLGIMGYAAINSDTVGQAMRFLLRYHELTSDRFRDRFEIVDGTAVLTPIPVLSHIRDLRNIAEDSLAGNWRCLKLLLGPNVEFRKASANFDFPVPEYEASYYEIFDCAVNFDSDRSELRFPAEWLDRPVQSANQSMADVCKAMCERLLGAGEASRETSQLVRRLLLSRPGRQMYRLEEAAAELNLSPHQLRKRLYKAGTSYKKLVLEIRMALAQHYLQDTDLAVQEIAYLLDYSQPAPFSRAFKAYVGVSPEQFRNDSRAAQM
jgi:AraC-like DNA-binding protein